MMGIVYIHYAYGCWYIPGASGLLPHTANLQWQVSIVTTGFVSRLSDTMLHLPAEVVRRSVDNWGHSAVDCYKAMTDSVWGANNVCHNRITCVLSTFDRVGLRAVDIPRSIARGSDHASRRGYNVAGQEATIDRACVVRRTRCMRVTRVFSAFDGIPGSPRDGVQVPKDATCRVRLVHRVQTRQQIEEGLREI